MKKIFFLILLSTLLVGCQNSNTNTKTDSSDNNPSTVIEEDQNDLVYHDYGTGIKLSADSRLIIKHLDLNLIDETAIIYVINLENNESYKLSNYQLYQDISYIPISDGVYNIIAVISNGEIIDIASKSIVETSNSDENTNGLILLQ